MSLDAICTASTKLKFWCNIITCPQFYCDYCVPVLLPLGSKDLAALQFSTNLALQRLTGSGGENLISNMLSTVCLREAWKSWHNLIREGFSSKYVSYVIERIQQFGVVNVVCLGREL